MTSSEAPASTADNASAPTAITTPGRKLVMRKRSLDEGVFPLFRNKAVSAGLRKKKGTVPFFEAPIGEHYTVLARQLAKMVDARPVSISTNRR